MVGGGKAQTERLIVFSYPKRFARESLTATKPEGVIRYVVKYRYVVKLRCIVRPVAAKGVSIIFVRYSGGTNCPSLGSKDEPSLRNGKCQPRFEFQEFPRQEHFH